MCVICDAENCVLCGGIDCPFKESGEYALDLSLFKVKE